MDLGVTAGSTFDYTKYLQDLLKAIPGMGSTTTQTTSGTSTQQTNPSAQLQSMYDSWAKGLTDVSSLFTKGYGDVQSALSNTSNWLQNYYKQIGSSAGSAAASGALASGMTPGEAAGEQLKAMLQVGQQYYPAFKDLQTSVAQTGVDNATAQAALNQTGLQGLSAMIPYLTAVAGTTNTQNQTAKTEDPLGNLNALLTLGSLLNATSSDTLSKLSSSLSSQVKEASIPTSPSVANTSDMLDWYNLLYKYDALKSSEDMNAADNQSAMARMIAELNFKSQSSSQDFLRQLQLEQFKNDLVNMYGELPSDFDYV